MHTTHLYITIQLGNRLAEFRVDDDARSITIGAIPCFRVTHQLSEIDGHAVPISASHIPKNSVLMFKRK